MTAVESRKSRTSPQNGEQPPQESCSNNFDDLLPPFRAQLLLSAASLDCKMLVCKLPGQRSEIQPGALCRKSASSGHITGPSGGYRAQFFVEGSIKNNVAAPEAFKADTLLGIYSVRIERLRLSARFTVTHDDEWRHIDWSTRCKCVEVVVSEGEFGVKINTFEFRVVAHCSVRENAKSSFPAPVRSRLDEYPWRLSEKKRPHYCTLQRPSEFSYSNGGFRGIVRPRTVCPAIALLKYCAQVV